MNGAGADATTVVPSERTGAAVRVNMIGSCTPSRPRTESMVGASRRLTTLLATVVVAARCGAPAPEVSRPVTYGERAARPVAGGTGPSLARVPSVPLLFASPSVSVPNSGGAARSPA